MTFFASNKSCPFVDVKTNSCKRLKTAQKNYQTLEEGKTKKKKIECLF